MKRIWCVGLFIIFCTNVSSQSLIDAYSLGNASADLCSPQNSYLNRNPASLTNQKNFAVSVNSILPYGLSALRSSCISISGIVFRKAMALDYSITHFEQYSEHLWSYSSGLKLAKHWSFGIKVINKIISSEVLQKSAFQAELGIIEQHNKKLNSALYFSYKNKQEDVGLNQSRLAIGIQYEFSSLLKNNFTVIANKTGGIAFRTSFQFTSKNYTQLLLGFSSVDAPVSTGISICWKSIQCITSASYHQQLGLSYGLGVCYVQQK